LAARLDAVSGIAGRFIGARRGSSRIAVEIKEFRGNSAIADARASEFNDTPSSNLLTAIFDSIRYLTTRKTAMY
jgi:hypothetical protein